MGKHLYILTDSYPYDDSAEGTFLHDEIKLYPKFFDFFTFIPLNTDGNLYDISGSLKINTALASVLKGKTQLLSLMRALNERLFWAELVRIIVTGRLQFFRQFLSFTIKAVIVKKWLTDNIKVDDTSNYFVYSYWANYSALGALLAFRRKNNIKILSRAHNIDLYEERIGYLPYQPSLIKYLALTIPVSEQGKTYLSARFPLSSATITTFRLGVSIPTECNSYSPNITIVSCSSVTPVKRVDLIFYSLCQFASGAKRKVSWHHFGAGSHFEELSRLVSKEDKLYLEIFLHGHVDNNKVLEFFKREPISCFINASEYEGIPVSIMEAQSYGIPVIATNVGGNSEIVINGLTGKLVSPSPTPEEMSKALSEVLERTETDFLRTNSRTHCIQNFNAELNYSKFLHFISEN